MAGKQLFHERRDTAKAGGAINEGHAVELGTNDREVTQANAVTDLVHGVALNTVKTGETVEFYREGGEAIGEAGGAVTKGASLRPNAAGELVVTSTAGQNAMGYALEAAADGDMFKFMFSRHQVA